MALEPRVCLDRHRSDHRDAAEIVAFEVDDHHVLGPLLRVAEELGGKARVLRRARPAPARSLDRPRLDPGASAPEEELRRVDDELRVAEVEVGAVRDRVPRREAGVERPGWAGEGGREGLGQVHLIGVAGGEVVENAPYGRAVAVGGPGGREGGRREWSLRGRCGRGQPREPGRARARRIVAEKKVLAPAPVVHEQRVVAGEQGERHVRRWPR